MNRNFAKLLLGIVLIMGLVILFQLGLADSCYRNSCSISSVQLGCIKDTIVLPAFPCNESLPIPDDTGAVFCGASVVARDINTGTSGNESSGLMSQSVVSQACYQYRICRPGWVWGGFPIAQNLCCVLDAAYDHGGYFSDVMATGAACPDE